MSIFDPLRDRANAAAYRIMYAMNPTKPPWEAHAPHPPLVELLDRGIVRKGRALDAGCGLGTQAIFLAQSGFDVEAIDFQPQAIEQARANAAAAGVTCRFERVDVSKRSSRQPYSLIIDRGCLHSLSPTAMRRYAENVKGWLAPGGHFQVSCFVWETPLEWLTPSMTPKMPAAKVIELFVGELELIDRAQVRRWAPGRPKMLTFLFRRPCEPREVHGR
ncbi:MAG: methyltransferase domain-containing protein [Myxococcales bacterium]|nr:methyltransferase domain-containing protein [Myxococcales bacterium]